MKEGGGPLGGPRVDTGLVNYHGHETNICREALHMSGRIGLLEVASTHLFDNRPAEFEQEKSLSAPASVIYHLSVPNSLSVSLLRSCTRHVRLRSHPSTNLPPPLPLPVPLLYLYYFGGYLLFKVCFVFFVFTV